MSGNIGFVEMIKKILSITGMFLLMFQVNGETNYEQPITKKPQQQKQVKQNNISIFSIASGTVGGNYFLLGNLIGSILSHSIKPIDCKEEDGCNNLELQIKNISSSGSIDNLNKIEEHQVDAGFVQADIAYWAYTATGIFKGHKKLDNLRAVASLYPESMHILVRRDAGIHSIADLKDKRIAVGDKDSGTVVAAQMILDSYKIASNEVKIEYINIDQAVEELQDKKIDALFFFVGYPAPFWELITDKKDYQFLSINSPEMTSVLSKGYYFVKETIPVGTYEAVDYEINTISTYALLITHKDANKSLIYQITKSLWDDESRILFNNSRIGSRISVEHSLNGIGIPLHEGAQKYYNEIGKRF